MLHATLSASSSHRWMNCPGSVRLSQGIEDKPSIYAQEGTKAHELAAELIQTKKTEGDPEMIEAVKVYASQVLGAFDEAAGDILLVEERFSLEALSPPDEMYGTSDAVIYKQYEQLLDVFDLKYGAGVPVEVKDNPQLMYYALGALLHFEQLFPSFIVKRVRLTIVQPRAEHPDGPVRSIIIKTEDLLAFAVDLMAAAHAALQEDAPLHPGDWCRFCPAKATCPALYEEVQALVQTEFEAIPADLPPAPDTLPMEVLTHVLDNLDVLEDWVRAVRQHAMRELEAGREVPGYKLVPKRAMRRWKDAQDATIQLMDRGYTEEDLLDRRLKSPAQIEKLLKSLGHRVEEVQVLWEKHSSGFNLAPDTDPRPAITAGADNDFEVTETGGDNE